jgi:hypothetical protein
MNNREIDLAVRHWIESSVDEFRAAIWLYGHRPKEVRPGLFRLFTPAPPVNSFPARRR